MKFPYFKYYLGYIHVYIHKKSVTKECRFCQCIFPGYFMKDAFKKTHKYGCEILKTKRTLFSLKR